MIIEHIFNLRKTNVHTYDVVDVKRQIDERLSKKTLLVTFDQRPATATVGISLDHVIGSVESVEYLGDEISVKWNRFSRCIHFDKVFCVPWNRRVEPIIDLKMTLYGIGCYGPSLEVRDYHLICFNLHYHYHDEVHNTSRDNLYEYFLSLN